MSYPATGHRRAIGVKPGKKASTSWGRTGRDLYFIREKGADGYVKIGRTDNVQSRLKQLQSGNARRLELVRVLPGQGPTEEVWHALFANDRIKGGEWFRPTRRLLDAIEAGALPRKGAARAVRKAAAKKQVYASSRMIS